ncbi:lipoate--protein ligase family protein [Amnibacterium sp. CER49]|uniref:lipoate--protein ligase family protein n=1 Tax=Amnibacterium sp. CER49 TaxID=3039161 RepID=UPI002446B017|nr:lipoate--protein ligase family protein [Amnibacterium sp. CER49]MDH2442936.1 lipoate--protein ligase family protein [Amnibacterium sp. CER49]
MSTVRLIDATTGDATDDLELSVRLLRAMTPGSTTRLVRWYRPLATAAFSRRETRVPGFDEAVSAAAAAGYVPAVRPTGGRAVVYDAASAVIDLVEPIDPDEGHRAVYQRVADAVVEVLRDLGADAAVGEVPGEYCPGDFSIGARGVVKLAGIAQRATRDGRLTSVVLSVQPSPQALALLTEIYDDMAFAWDPSTFGSLEHELGTEVPADLAERLCAGLAPEGLEARRWSGETYDA